MTQTKCAQCGYNPKHPLWECSRIECQHRKPQQPRDTTRHAYDGSFEPLLDGWKRAPTNREER